MNKSSKKRILFIITTPFYQEKGSSLRIFEVVKMLAEEYEIDLVTYSLGRDVNIKNVTIYRTLKSFKPSIGVSEISLSRIVLDILVFITCIKLIFSNKYDIIHSEDFEAAFIGRVLCVFKRKTKFVYDLHNRVLDNLELKGNKYNSLFRWLINVLEKFVLSRTNLVILNWKKYEKDLIFKNRSVLTLYDKIDIDALEEHDKPDEPYLIYTGNFEPYQGIKVFLEVFREVEIKYKLLLVGAPTDEIRQFVAKDSSLNKRVMFTGRLSIGASNYLIKHAVAGILPRLNEASSMKVVHYLMMGKPVIATDTPSNRELLKDNDNGLLYSNQKELTSILKNIESQPGLIEKFRDGVHKTANIIKKNWDATAFLEKYRQL